MVNAYCFIIVGRNIRGQITQWLQGNLWVKSLNWLNYFYFTNESLSTGTQFQPLWAMWLSACTPHLRARTLPHLAFPPLCSTVNYFLQRQKQSPPFQQQVIPAPHANQSPDVGPWSSLVVTPCSSLRCFSNICSAHLSQHLLPVSDTAPSLLLSAPARLPQDFQSPQVWLQPLLRASKHSDTIS